MSIPNPKFRSLFAHEPLSVETYGYILVQGALSPRCCQPIADETNQPNEASGPLFPLDILKDMLEYKFCTDPTYKETTDPLSSLCLRKLPHIAQSVELLESAGVCTKARITYKSPQYARRIAAYLKRYPPTPHQLLDDLLSRFTTRNNNKEGEKPMVAGRWVDEFLWKFGNKSTLTTQITTSTLDLPRDQYWGRTAPPKFRRIVLSTDKQEVCDDSYKVQMLESLRSQRSQTRFVFMTNMNPSMDSDTIDPHLYMDEDGDNVHEGQQLLEMYGEEDCDSVGVFQDALRQALNQFDSTNAGIEVFVTRASYNRRRLLPCPCSTCGKQLTLSIFHHVHIGMRCPNDAQRVVNYLQGECLTLKLEGICTDTLLPRSPEQGHECCSANITTGKLFLDYVDVLNRSLPALNRSQSPSDNPTEDSLPSVSRPTLPDCTSTTSNVEVPGLLLIPDFISKDEEEVLLAALNGPDAPWAPSQRNFSNTGSVKRRVQHYGYVFDYETADVIRNRMSDDKSCCPPIPALPQHLLLDCDEGQVEKFIQQSTAEGNGWALLAGITEKLRNFKFSSSSPENDPIPRHFPHLNQITVNEYKPGEGIGCHVDTLHAFSDGIMSISLGGDCVMEFRLPTSEYSLDNHDRTSNAASKPTRYILKKLVHLPPRSLLLMSGPARYDWEHMIVSRMSDVVEGEFLPRRTRVSITLRTALNLSLDGSEPSPLKLVQSSAYPPKWGCISQSTSSLVSTLVTPTTERKHVHAVYDAIATQWHHTRGKRGVIWPTATQFLKNLPRGSIVADVGCGDGKYFSSIWDSGSYVLGLDISLPLLQAARSSLDHYKDRTDFNEDSDIRGDSTKETHGFSIRPAVMVADCIHIPIRDNSIDAAICIAVMHHLSTVERRIRCLEELSRIVKEGGLINVQAWAKEQEESSRWKFSGTDVFVPFNAQPRYLDKVSHKPGKWGASSLEINGDCQGSVHDGVGRMYSEAYDGAEYDEDKGLVVFQRYCHLYRQGELEELVAKVSTLDIIESGMESGNHFVILRVRSK